MTAFLQTVDGDLDLSSHNLKIVADTSTVTTQKCKDVLWLFLGEWFLDTSVGTPWFQLVLGKKNPDFVAIKSAIRSRLLAVDGVSAVKDISFNWNSSVRELDYTIVIVLNNGQQVTITPG